MLDASTVPPPLCSLREKLVTTTPPHSILTTDGGSKGGRIYCSQQEGTFLRGENERMDRALIDNRLTSFLPQHHKEKKRGGGPNQFYSVQYYIVQAKNTTLYPCKHFEVVELDSLLQLLISCPCLKYLCYCSKAPSNSTVHLWARY